MSDTRTKPVDGFKERDFNSEPFLTDFQTVYEGMHTSGCLEGEVFLRTVTQRFNNFV